MGDQKIRKIAIIIIWAVMAWYTYNAWSILVKIGGRGGYSWGDVSEARKAYDLVYVLLTFCMVSGFLRRWRISYGAFIIMCVSQSLVYTIGQPLFFGSATTVAASAHLTAAINSQLLILGFIVVLGGWALYFAHITPKLVPDSLNRSL